MIRFDTLNVDSLPSNRKFGWFFTVVFFAFALLAFWKQFFIIAVAIQVVAFFFLAATLFTPQLLEPLNRLWYELGMLLGKIVSPIFLGLMFFMLITPISLLMRLFGRDELKIKKRNVESYWVYRSKSASISESFKNQF